MILFDLIKCATLHIGRYSRLLICSLFFYGIHTSCSTQVQYGLTKALPQNENQKKKKKFANLSKNQALNSMNIPPIAKKSNNLTKIKNKLTDVAIELLLLYKNHTTNNTNNISYNYISEKIHKYCQLNPNCQIKDREKKIKNLLCKTNINHITTLISPDGENLLHLIVRLDSEKERTPRQKRFLADIFNTLITTGPSLANKANKEEKTPLHLAAELGNLAMFTILLPSTTLPAGMNKLDFLYCVITYYCKSDVNANTQNGVQDIIKVLLEECSVDGYFGDTCTKNIDILVNFIILILKKYKPSATKQDFLVEVANKILLSKKSPERFV